jgi:Amidohydrolase
MSSALSILLPYGSCDSHVHVIGPKRRFPLAPGHRYTPKDAPVGALAAMLKRLGLGRVVIVQPSFYGSDNACLLDAMAQLDNVRGVAVLAQDTSASELDELQAQGIRGLRVNIASLGPASLDAIKAAVTATARLCERHGWHVQMFVDSNAIEPLAPLLKALPVDSVFDHFGLCVPWWRRRPAAGAATLAGERQGLGKDIRRLSHQRRPAGCAHRSDGARSVRNQPRAYRLGFRLAAYAAAQFAKGGRRRITLPKHRYARLARLAAALARGREIGTAGIGAESRAALWI